jgi:hypothetical protein
VKGEGKITIVARPKEMDGMDPMDCMDGDVIRGMDWGLRRV